MPMSFVNAAAAIFCTFERSTWALIIANSSAGLLGCTTSAKRTAAPRNISVPASAAGVADAAGAARAKNASAVQNFHSHARAGACALFPTPHGQHRGHGVWRGACGAARLSNATRRSDTRRHRCLRRWRLQPARVLPAPSSSSCVTGTTAWCRGRWWSGSKVRRVGGSRRQVASSTSCMQTRPQRIKSSSRALFFTCRASSRHPASAMAELAWSRVHYVWASGTTNCQTDASAPLSSPLPGMARCTIVLPPASRPRNRATARRSAFRLRRRQADHANHVHS